MNLAVTTDLSPVGESLRWTADDVARMSAITPDARREAVLLLYGLGWHRTTAHLRTPEAWLWLLLGAVASVVELATRMMAEGRMSLEEWQGEVGRIVRQGYVAAAILGAQRAYLDAVDDVLATGVPDPTLPTDGLRARAEAHAFAELRFSLGRLERFARTLEAGITLTTTEAQAVARGRLYANYAKVPFFLARNDERKAAGLTEQVNVLNPSKEHCEECIRITQMGWVPIGSVAPPGRRKCSALCGCTFRFR